MTAVLWLALGLAALCVLAILVLLARAPRVAGGRGLAVLPDAPEVQAARSGFWRPVTMALAIVASACMVVAASFGVDPLTLALLMAANCSLVATAVALGFTQGQDSRTIPGRGAP